MRAVAAFLSASFITLVLFCLMQYLITGGQRSPLHTDSAGVVELITLQPDALQQQETPARSHAPASQPQSPEQTLPVPRPLSARAESPPLPPPGIERPQPPPLQIATAPDLGAFDDSAAAVAPATPQSPSASPAQTAPPHPAPGGSVAAAMPTGPTTGPGGGDGNVLPLLRIEPVYPRKAARDRKEGWVKVEFTISERGTVIDPVVVESRPRRIFNRSALAAIRKWRFKPRMVAGKPVPARATQVIEFNLAGR